MKKAIFIAVLLVVGVSVKSQNNAVPPLEREVTLSVSDETIPFILNTISQQTEIVFSYSPDIISTTSKISINVKGKPVRYVLNTLFSETVKYKVRGKYIILRKNEPSKEEQKREVVVEGYLYDSQTGNKLTDATVYNKEQKVSAITDKYGYFKLEVPTEEYNTELKISKRGYTDTMLTAISGNLNYVDLELASKPKVAEMPIFIEPKEDQSKITIPEWLIANKLLINTRNISDTLFSKFQISLVPYVSTNKLLSGKTVNDYSFNVTVGYVQGVRKVELGGIANIVREDAGVCQLAGVANVVGGLSYGFQGAGTFNAVKSLNGIQSAGILNFVLDDAGYVQLGGTGNIVGGKFYGVQVAGVFNHTNKIVGTQVAGVFNNTDSLDGVQISGVLNRASYFKGYQIGVINYADSCNGIPFGLFNFVRKGYHKIELSADEVFYSNIAFRSGVQKFHSIVTVGVRPNELQNPLWSFGYGVGTSFEKSSKILYDLDFTVHQLAKGNYISEKNKIYKITTGVDWKVGPKISLAFGLSYNLYFTNSQSKYYDSTFSSVPPYTISSNQNGSTVLKTWFGGKVGIRFL